MTAAPATAAGAGPEIETRARRVALLGNPNTGKTTLFNRLCGLRHKTSNFPGTTQEARVGAVRDPGHGALELIDLPGVYSLELEQSEAEICRRVLAGTLAPKGEELAAPDAALVILDATNLARNLLLAGEVLRRRLPTVAAVNMIDLAEKRGVRVDAAALEARLGCRVALISARSGRGVEGLRGLLAGAVVPNRTPPGTQEGLEAWAEEVYADAARGRRGGRGAGRGSMTDRIDHVLTHPVLGVVAFVAIMAGLFWTIFSLAKFPMDLLQGIFSGNKALIAAWEPGWLQGLMGEGLAGLVTRAMPPGILREFLAGGVVRGVGSTVVFLPQICLLFFLISVLEDTGYLARAAFVMDRALRPFGLPGHSFVPLLSSHACALPGIMACRGIPDRRERLATILVAPFMTCSARLPVYVLVTSILFPGSPGRAALAFIGCYALGMGAGVLSALLARRTILKGPSRAMALELPTYKMPSVRTSLLTTYDRGLVFLKKAGTNILAICIVLWWLGAYPRVEPPQKAVELRAVGNALLPDAGVEINGETWCADQLFDEADRVERMHAKAHSFVGMLGRGVQPVFAPLGFDWQLTVGVLTSFAAREVFVSTMAVIVTGNEDKEAEGVIDAIAHAKRSDGVTPVFTPAVSWALLVYYVLAMQCLPTLAVTARESGHVKWALLQLVWMSGLAYVAGAGVYWGVRAVGG